LPGGRTRLVYGPEISYKRTEDREADARRINQQCLDWCATNIRQQPEDWLWSYKWWKFKPADGDDRYPYYSRLAWF
jgi:lauroyl/myristoyl acyltransferase